MLKAILFNLDGVIADLSKYHYIAWKSIFSQHGMVFDKELWKQICNHSRQSIINSTFKYNKVEPNEPLMLEIETKKNDLYKSLITDQLGPSNVYSNTLDVLFQAKQKDLKICVLSHSKNAEIIIQRLGLLNAFDYVCIPEDQSNDDSITRPVGSSYITKSIDSFLKKTGFLGKECIGIENTKLGLDEFNSFGIFSVCIDNFDKEIAKDSKISFHTVADVNLDEIIFKYYTIMGDE